MQATANNQNFNFEIGSNVILNPDNSAQYRHLDSSNDCDLIIDKELRRRRVLFDLHQKYEKKFAEIFYTQTVPKDSLNRFLYEQLSLCSQRDYDHDKEVFSTCFNKPENILIMDTLAKEITTAYPLIARANKSIPDEQNWFKVQKKIDEYLHLAFIFLKNDLRPSENARQVSNLIFKFAALYDLADFDEYSSRLKEKFWELYTRCFEYFKSNCEIKIKQVCEFMNECVKQTSSELIEIATSNIITMPGQLQVKHPNSNCSNKSVELSFRDCSFQIHLNYYDKLRILYEKNAVERIGLKFDQIEFDKRVFCIICRYESYFKNSLKLNEGYGMQAALPPFAFDQLNKSFEVSQEMFASPFNCYFSTFCSAFPDTDKFFGSMGSFFCFKPQGGSLQCNPPFTEECIERMADRIYLLLDAANEHALSFIVFIPEWIDPPTPGLVKMKNSKFLRHTSVLPRGRHKYVTGSQYLEQKYSRKYYNSAHDTRFFILQNELAFKKWKPTQEKIQTIERRLVFEAHKGPQLINNYMKRPNYYMNSNYWNPSEKLMEEGNAMMQPSKRKKSDEDSLDKESNKKRASR